MTNFTERAKSHNKLLLFVVASLFSYFTAQHFNFGLHALPRLGGRRGDPIQGRRTSALLRAGAENSSDATVRYC